ncbi:hypothetical protein LUZ62_039297 [Rhynchospora pubera]|uniref:Uncharacterized protein n=1 Tax=Rhynchospora pubera TaxID=906938 RepID=A0AAV8FBF8_9POAL|nr:hypothetical protein LUZ62_001628 [Rhynchospora pubera]KAJ4788051.1 hypothetical protein LUZ62_039297 [Rhynchospora pubera]
MGSLSLSRGSKPVQMEYGKRLSELLKEQQEPFLLDEYLKQNGCSRRSPKCHQSGFGCSLSVYKKLLKRRSRGSTTGTTALRSVLNKIMYHKVIRKLMNCGCGKQMQFRRLDNSFEGDSSGEDEDWKQMEVTSRQLSPVSVFELHSDEDSSPTHEYTNFEDEELSPSCRGLEGETGHQISAISSLKNDSTNVQSSEEMIWEPQESLRQMSLKQTEEQVLSWEKITRDITKIPTLVEDDFTKTEREWCQLKQDIGEVGSKIETLIFEEIREEAVLDLLDSHCTL